MKMDRELPDIDKLPSLLEVSKVSTLLDEIISIGGANPDIFRNDIASAMVDVIFAQGYRPDKQFDTTVESRILNWICEAWPKGDLEFADAASTVLCNLQTIPVVDEVSKLLNRELREEAKLFLNEVLDEYRDR